MRSNSYQILMATHPHHHSADRFSDEKESQTVRASQSAGHLHIFPRAGEVTDKVPSSLINRFLAFMRSSGTLRCSLARGRRSESICVSSSLDTTFAMTR